MNEHVRILHPNQLRKDLTYATTNEQINQLQLVRASPTSIITHVVQHIMLYSTTPITSKKKIFWSKTVELNLKNSHEDKLVRHLIRRVRCCVMSVMYIYISVTLRTMGGSVELRWEWQNLQCAASDKFTVTHADIGRLFFYTIQFDFHVSKPFFKF